MSNLFNKIKKSKVREVPGDLSASFDPRTALLPERFRFDKNGINDVNGAYDKYGYPIIESLGGGLVTDADGVIHRNPGGFKVKSLEEDFPYEYFPEDGYPSAAQFRYEQGNEINGGLGPYRDDYVDHLMEKRRNQFERDQAAHDMWEQYGQSHYAPVRTRQGIQLFTDDMPEPAKPYMPSREEVEEMLRKRQGQPTGEEL